MTTGESSKPAAPAKPATPSSEKQGSGEGAATALQALIRKRKLVEKPDNPLPQPPEPRQL